MFGIFKKNKAAKKPAANKPAKKTGGKKPFGGYSINFNGRTETLEQVFGRGPIAPSAMTKKIWNFVKSKRLGSR